MWSDRLAQPLAAPQAALDVTSIPLAWRRPLAQLGVLWLVLFVVFRAEWADMAAQWWDSSTYNHILLIPAILGWLAWQRASQLAQLRPMPWWPGLLLFALALLLWVLGSFAGLSLARQAGAVGVLIASVPALFGPKVSTALAFPLFYMVILVPFGDEMVPALQAVTAVLTIALTQLSGIPAAIDGVFIDTPAGLFEVAEACSGVKFLIAMIAFGLLTANLCFTSWRRRIVFMAFCVAVPILANGVRAWGTILAAQWVGAEKATGFDHIVYGWFFFALVIALVLAGAWRFFDRAPADVPVDLARIEASPLLARLERWTLNPVLALVGLAGLLAGSLAWASAAATMEAELPARMVPSEVPGWTRVAYAPRHAWQPRAEGAKHRLIARYRNVDGHKVDLFYALYAHQREGSEAGGFGQGALQAGQGWSWLESAPSLPGCAGDRLLAAGRTARLVQTCYRHGALLTGSNAALKLAVMADRLRLKRHATALIILSVEERPGYDAAAALDAFTAATGPLGAWSDRLAGSRP